MDWFEKNPLGPQDMSTFTGFRREAMFDMHKWGRSAFANSFARQGFASVALAPTAGKAFKAAFSRTHRQGSAAHIKNLNQMLSNAKPGSPQYENIAKALSKAEQGTTKAGLMKRIGGVGLGAAFALMPAFTTPGGLPEKGRAVAGGLAGVAGWEVGSKFGMGLGAAIGSVIPGLGTAIGAGVGYIAGGLAGAIGFDEGAQALMRIPDNMVEEERKKRRLNWRGDQTAFMTRSAHTMRQQSLQAMNRGMNNARSMLGREGVFLHQ